VESAPRKFVIAADEERAVLLTIVNHLRARGHEAELLPITAWADAALAVADSVKAQRADIGIVCCHTGTGVSIAANKVAGIRAALCGDAQTAAGARKWNDANVLALSLRTLSDAVAIEIVDAFLDSEYTRTEDASLALIAARENAARENT
jgi:ribose 5-phosphate isomerase B